MRYLSLTLLMAAPSAVFSFAPTTSRRWASVPAINSRRRTSLFADTAVLNAAAASSPLLNGKCVVSGFLTESAASEQFVFDLLHKHDVFKKIVAVCPDPDSAKKRLMSRSARYTGLLDVLSFSEGSSVPLTSELEGAVAWLAFGAAPSEAAAQAEAAVKAGIKHLVVVASGEGKVDFTDAKKKLEGSATAFTFIQTGSLVAGKEGGGIILEACGGCDGSGEHAVIPEGATVVREDAVRVATEAFMLPPSKDKTFALTSDSGGQALKYLKEVRGKGYTRQQEVGFLMTGGFQEFVVEEEKKAKEEADKEAAKNREMTPEEKAAKKAKEAQSDAEMFAEMEAEKKARKEKMILDLANKECEREWIKQRYAKQQEAGVSSDYGIFSRDTYFERNLDLFIKDVRERGEFNSEGMLVLLTEEDRERARDIAKAEAREARIEEERLARELEKELDRQVEEMKFEFEGKTYVKFEAKTKTVILDEEGVDIVGQWNEETKTIDPYEDDLGVLAEIAAFEEEQKEAEEAAKKAAKTEEPAADAAEKEE